MLAQPAGQAPFQGSRVRLAPERRPQLVEVDLDAAMIEKEAVTVVLSDKGWIRAMKGHVDDLAKLEFKQGDGLKRALQASTTDKLILFATNGKFFTLEANKLPGGRGHGEPIRLPLNDGSFDQARVGKQKQT